MTSKFKFLIETYSTILVFILFYFTSFAQSEEKRINIQLSNKATVRIQACSDRIFRIRVSADNLFPETLMERYGILKTDWNASDAWLKTEKGKQVIATTNYRLEVNPKTGGISVTDPTVKTLIDRISVIDSKNSLYTERVSSLNTYFGKPTTSAEIIGSNKGPAENKELNEVEVVSIDPGEQKARITCQGKTIVVNVSPNAVLTTPENLTK